MTQRQRRRHRKKEQRNYRGVCVCILLILLFAAAGLIWHIRHAGQQENVYESYDNCYIAECEDDTITLLTGGQTKQYRVQNLKQDLSDTFADVEIENGYVTKIKAKQDRIRGTVLAVGENSVTIEDYGELPLTEDFQVYKNFGTLGKTEKNQIPVNHDLTWFYLEGDQICGAVILRDIAVEDIRVLISSSDYSSYDHEAVTVTCKEAFVVHSGEERTVYQAGEKLSVTWKMLEDAGGELMIVSSSETKPIQVTTIERSYGKPEYYGKLYVSMGKTGVRIVNELPLEQYLYYVVPSEMPASYELEALKAQAVCARTFAARAILDDAYGSYGAHVDDSIACQVYNNGKPTARVKQAVNETYGEILEYDGEPITAYFFSTSCGLTTDRGDSGVEPYLKGKAVTENEAQAVYKEEASFSAFIHSEADGYEKEFPYYRWQISYTGEELGNLIKNATGKEIGAVTAVSVTKRGTNGIVEAIQFRGEKGTVSIEKEYTIRRALSMDGKVLSLHDGSKRKDGGTLPSAFFVVEKQEKSFQFYGGGYGHGLGMSQNGACQMAKEGMEYSEILKFFYNEIQIGKLY